MNLSIFGLLAICIASNASTLDSLIAKRRSPKSFTLLKDQLDSGKTSIDYTQFRNLYVESESFAKKSIETFSSLQKAAFKGYSAKDFKCVVDNCKKMIEYDYTSMIAHKMLVDAYSNLGDSIASHKHQSIELGLLKSISKSGDGRTCRTGWKVIQVEEEYFVINYALNGSLVSQKLYNVDGICDQMIVQRDSLRDTVYFEISKVMESYQR